MINERFRWDAGDIEVVVRKYDPDQPRAPRGTDTGGRWIARDMTLFDELAEHEPALATAVAWYMGTGHHTINHALRTGALPPGRAGESDRVRRTIAEMDRAFAQGSMLVQRAPTATVYRGVTGSAAERITALAAGSTFTDRGWVSTSEDPEQALGFSRPRLALDNTGRGVLLKITLAGTHRVLQGNPDEAEYILQRGAHFRKTHMRTTLDEEGYLVTEVTVDYLGSEEAWPPTFTTGDDVQKTARSRFWYQDESELHFQVAAAVVLS